MEHYVLIGELNIGQPVRGTAGDGAARGLGEPAIGRIGRTIAADDLRAGLQRAVAVGGNTDVDDEVLGGARLIRNLPAPLDLVADRVLVTLAGRRIGGDLRLARQAGF